MSLAHRRVAATPSSMPSRLCSAWLRKLAIFVAAAISCVIVVKTGSSAARASSMVIPGRRRRDQTKPRRAVAGPHVGRSGGIGRQRSPDVRRFADRFAEESRRSDTDNREHGWADRDSAPDRARVLPEPARPVAIADHSDRLDRAEIVVAGGEGPSCRSGHAEHGKVVSGDRLPIHQLRFAVDRCPDAARRACGEDVGDVGATFPELLERGIREVVVGASLCRRFST